MLARRGARLRERIRGKRHTRDSSPTGFKEEISEIQERTPSTSTSSISSQCSLPHHSEPSSNRENLAQPTLVSHREVSKVRRNGARELNIFSKFKPRRKVDTVSENQHSQPSVASIESTAILSNRQGQSSQNNPTASEIATTVLRGIKESTSAFPPLQSAVGGLLYILELCEELKSQEEQVKDIHARIVKLAGFIDKQLRCNDYSDVSPEVVGIFDELSSCLVLIQESLPSLSKRSRFRRFLCRSKCAKSLSKATKEIDAALTTFEHSMIVRATMNIEGLIKQNNQNNKKTKDVDIFLFAWPAEGKVGAQLHLYRPSV